MRNHRTRAWAPTAAAAAALLASAPVPAQRPDNGSAEPPMQLTALDYIEIEQLNHKYAWAIDTCSRDGFDYADLYTPDGVFVDGETGRKWQGREELAKAAGGNGGGCPFPKLPLTHVILNLVIEATPDGAVGKSYLVYPGKNGEVVDKKHSGYDGGYQDTYVKTPQGWRFKERIHVQPPQIPGEYRGVPNTELEARAEAARGAIVGTGAFTSFVENMDRSLAFYHDVFGMEVPPMPESGARPYNPENPQLYAMFDIPGAMERHQSARVPGTDVRVEIMEVQGVEHRTVPLHIQDPGAATIVFIVRDVDEMLGRVRRANADIVTPGGEPVRLTDGGRSVLIRDVDGRFIELRDPAAPAQAPPRAAPGEAAGNGIVDMRLSIAVDDIDQTTRVYRDALGFRVEGDASLAADSGIRALTGLATAEVRRNRVQAPGSSLWIELVEYRGVDRHPLKMRIQDRGAARLQLRAEHLDQVVAAMKNAGLTVVSEGGGAVPIPPNFRGALVADPNNFFVTPFERCDGCAPTFGTPRH